MIRYEVDVHSAADVVMTYSSKMAQIAIGELHKLSPDGGVQVVDPDEDGSTTWTLEHGGKYVLYPEGSRLTDPEKPRMAMKLTFYVDGTLTAPVSPPGETEPTLMLDKVSDALWRGEPVAVERY